MITVKEKKHYAKSDDNRIEIRSLKNDDLSFFYLDWQKSYYKDNYAYTLSQEEFERLVKNDLKNKIVFIILINKTPCGEITLWKDSILRKLNKQCKKPVYGVSIQYQTPADDMTQEKVIKLLHGIITKDNLKIRTLSATPEKNALKAYLNCGYKQILSEDLKSVIDTFFQTFDSENKDISSDIVLYHFS
ncbi:hypothetical protein K7I13_03005 [Brucepastera parasyntrophica]|uniref:hypothetical protein n=1 Tax=Brucepastera parasyntrophica TaxID=2880008 RepID=UPI00210C5526|nr:hypothetical protein [Brucepastera parasyntrophica]ULQ60294.1 hypothetical protein K7I13_03005 [Brucepastera parasyntrophica]